MLKAFQTRDTVEMMRFRDVKDGCVVTDTHLAAVIAVTGANLFEKKEADAIAYLSAFGGVLDQLGFPVQLVSQSRPRQFDGHIAWAKHALKENDFRLVMEKDPEWYRLYYADAIAKGEMTEEELERIIERGPEKIDRSMLESYVERLETVVKEHSIKEKRYYVVVSTLDAPKGIWEKDEQDYDRVSFEIPEVFEKYSKILAGRAKKTLDLITENAGMGALRLDDDGLMNLLYDAFNFPASYKHRIDPKATEYGKIPPILDGKAVKKSSDAVGDPNYAVRAAEWGIDRLSSLLSVGYDTKGAERDKVSNRTLQLLKPYSIDDSQAGFCTVNGQYLFTVHVDSFGDEFLEDVSLWPVMSTGFDYDLSVHLIPLDRDATLLELERKSDLVKIDAKDRMDGKSSAEAKVIEGDARKKFQNYETLKSDLRNGKTGVWSVSIDVTFRASTLAELAKVKEAVRSKLAVRHVNFSEAEGDHYAGFVSTCPLLTNLVAGYNRPFERMVKFTQEVRHFYPFTPSAVQSSKGTMLGLSIQGDGADKTYAVEFFDLFDRTRIINSILGVIGNSGSGKTTWMQGFAKNQNLLGYRFLMFDYLGNYRKWAEDLPDAYNFIRIDPTSPMKVNPCDIILPSRARRRRNPDAALLSDEEAKENAVNEKLAELSEYFRIFLEGYYDPVTRGILDETAKRVYLERLASEPFDEGEDKVVGDVMLSQIVDAVRKSGGSDAGKKEHCRKIADMLTPYATGGLSKMFNTRTNVRIDERNVVFYLRENKEQRYEEIATLQCFLLARQALYRSRNNVVMIDELHKIFRMESKEIGNFFKNQIATVRNLDGGVIGMTQLLKQIMKSDAGQEFLDMANTKLYLAGWQTQDAEDTDVAKYDTTLSKSSKQFLTANNRPGFGVLKLGQEQLQVRIANHPDLALFKRYKPQTDA